MEPLKGEDVERLAMKLATEIQNMNNYKNLYKEIQVIINY